MSKVFNITLTHAMMLVTGRPVCVELDVVLGRLTVSGTKRKDMMEYHLSWLNGLMPLNIGQRFDAACLLKETMPQHRMNVVGILLCKKGHLPSFKTIGLYISYLTSCYRSFAVIVRKDSTWVWTHVLWMMRAQMDSLTSIAQAIYLARENARSPLILLNWEEAFDKV